MDFHGTDIDERLVRSGELGAGAEVDAARTLIWRCSSSLTDKAPFAFSRPPAAGATREERGLWGRLQPAFDRIAKDILEGR